MPTKKAASTAKQPVESEEEDNSKAIAVKTSRKPPLTPRKRKEKEPEVEVIESDDGDLSPDTTKPIPKKKKKQPKISEVLAQPPIKVSKTQTKKYVTPRALEVNPEALSNKFAEQIESDTSSPEAEGPKGVTESIEQIKTQQNQPISSSGHTYHPTSTPSYHPTSPKESNMESTDEVNKPADNQATIIIEDDENMANVKEPADDKSEDGSP